MKYKKVTGGYQITKISYMESGIKLEKGIRNKSSSMTKKGKITLRPGFFSDGATGAIDTKELIEKAFWHDFLCNEYNKGNLNKEQRKLADKFFKSELKKTNMSKFRIKYIYQIVRKFFELKGWFKKVF